MNEPTMPDQTGSADAVKDDIIQARAELAHTVEQLSERLNPKKQASRTLNSATRAMSSPTGKKVVAATATAVVLVLVIRQLRTRRARS